MNTSIWVMERDNRYQVQAFFFFFFFFEMMLCIRSNDSWELG